MTAGTGIVHSETNRSAAPCHLLQIWIEPSGPGLTPGYEQKPFAIARGWTLLIDPEGREGAMAIHRPVRLWRALAGADLELGCPVAPGAQGWIQMIAGELIVSETPAVAGDSDGTPAGNRGVAGGIQGVLRQGDGLGFAPGRLTSLRAGAQGADLLLFELR
jgi:hypothetical protein